MGQELNQCMSTYKGVVLNNVPLTSLLVPPTEEWQQDIGVTRYSVAYVTNNLTFLSFQIGTGKLISPHPYIELFLLAN